MSKRVHQAEMPSIVNVDGAKFRTESLFRADTIEDRVDEMGHHLAARYAKKRAVHVVQIHSGGGRYGFNLLDAMQDYDPELDITSSNVTVSSQSGKGSSGVLRIESRPSAADITGRHVLLVDGIMDSGLTLDSMAAIVNSHEPASLEVAVAMRKNVPRHLSELLGGMTMHVGFDDVPDVALAGYGLDVGGRFRNFAGVYALTQVLAA
jgi:hypoxanthine phosphoribosyltransferase